MNIKRDSVGMQSALIWSIIWWVLVAVINIIFQIYQRDESRIFEIKQQVYSDFIEKYYEYFSDEAIREEYERLYEIYVYKFISINDNSFYLESIENCKYDITDNCLIFGENNDILITIEKAQSDAFLAAINNQYEEYSLYLAQVELVIPKEIFYLLEEEVISIQKLTNYSFEESCSNSNMCGIQYIWNAYEATKYLFSEKIISILKKDLQSHY